MNSSYNKKSSHITQHVKGKSPTGRSKTPKTGAKGKVTIGVETPPVIKKVSKKANRYFILFFFVCTVILYGNTVLNKWSVDDKLVTGPQNEMVTKGFKAIPEIFTSFYVVTKGNVGSQLSDYRPIVKLTYAIEYGLWGGQKPGRSHAVNVLIYFWIIILLFFILKRLLWNYNILFPFLITLLFMAHPVHTEAVASLKNRDELLAFLCGLGGMYYFLKYADTRKVIYVFVALIVFITGYLSKSSALPFVLLYPLVLHFFTNMKVKEFVWIFVVVLIAGLLAQLGPKLFLPKAIHINAFIENPLFVEKSLWLRIGTSLMTLLFYLRILVFPYPLLYYYGYDMIPLTGPLNIFALLSFVINGGALFYAFRKLREKHFLSFAILWYFIAIAIYSNLLTPVVGIVAERFVFNASLGFIMLLVFFLFRIMKTEPMSLTIEFSERAKILVIVFLLLIPSTAMTIVRNRDWRNVADLYSADIKHQGNSVKANVEYAEYLVSMVYQDPNYQQHGIVNEQLQQVIISYYRKALKLYPDDYTTLNNLAAAYIRFTNNADSGMVFVKKAVALRPDLQSAWVNMAMAYRKKNQPDSAIACYQRVLQINPGAITAVYKIADLYNEKGELNKAISINEDIIKAYPTLDVPYFNIGYYYIMHGDTNTAIKYWEQAARRNASYEVCYNLAMMYKGKGNLERAEYFSNLAKEAQARRQQNNSR